jgi:hypothetical protein
MMTFLSMQHMPLSSAYLCEDCHCIGNCAEQCPACASAALMSLAGVLNREMPAEKVNLAYTMKPHIGSVVAALAA